MQDPTDSEPQGKTAPQTASKAANEPIRSSFSLDRWSREEIRRLSETLGVTQGEIVGRSALLFSLVAARSLERRKKALPILDTMLAQAERSLQSITSIAPHLRGAIEAVSGMLGAISSVESLAIEQRSIHGIQNEDSRYAWTDQLTLAGAFFDEAVDEDYVKSTSPFLDELRKLFDGLKPGGFGLPEFDSERADFKIEVIIDE